MHAIITLTTASFPPEAIDIIPVISRAVGIKFKPITIIIGPTT